ncbi:hypothetical protein [Pimelobacter simplex]|uniref:hypothetical protein n=1 Tax=Nocardioides simplex TaxID=2045 RepID=UPI0021501971|nr:hypothetical protein [Pimelobacter simplex]UUW89621.1 hypothetical protein M0M43_28410 [Pimelobacter simplex]UUW93450.1 hypothetical protein M0M48_17065 [Pimelobacter simplex]
MTRRLAAVLVTAAVLATGAPSLAAAADHTHTDAARDVRSGAMRSAGDTLRRPEPRERGVDIRTIRVSHLADRVVVKVRTRAAIPTKKYFVGVALRLPGGAIYEASAYKYRGMSSNQLTTGPDDKVECAGYRLDIDRARRVTTAVVPTTCLGDPAWVRVAVGAARFTAKRVYADDGLDTGPMRSDYFFTPRIARG